MSSNSTPTRTKSQKLGDLGEIETARVFLRWGWTAEPINSDYGEDLDCNIFFESQRSNLHFRCQVKSTYFGRGQVRLLKNGDYSVSISSSILRIWMRSFYPVILTVYDHSSGKIFWLNASAEIHKILDKLSQKSVVLHVSQNQELVNGKEKVLESIVSYYSDILRISNARITCNIIPVLMPEYFGCGIWHWIDWLEKLNWDEINAKPIFLKYEILPAWAMSIQSLEPSQGILGICVTLSTSNPEAFINAITAKLPITGPNKERAKWISYIFSPLKLEGDIDDVQENESFWSRELTGWSNYICIDEIILPEKEFIFARPERFLSPIGKAAGFGWGIYPYVSRELDLALRFFATVEATSSFILETQARKQIYESQYLPWSCPVDELDTFGDLLHKVELGFMIIEELSTENTQVGVICNHFFDPSMQMYQAPHYWSDRLGGISIQLGQLIDKLPGEEAISRVSQFMLDLAGHILKTDHIKYLTMDQDSFLPGLPTEITKRVIEVTRYRVVTKDFDEANGSRILDSLISEIEIAAPQNRNTSATIDLFQDITEQICCLKFSWQPPINVSSSQSFNQVSEYILGAFNRILPDRSEHKEISKTDTYNIFRLNGAVVFEDDPDYFKRYFR